MQSTTAKIRNLAAAIIGNALEWYDFLVFAFMTPIISTLFFPTPAADGSAGSELNSILLMTAIFGVGFFMRPIGGVILGLYADRKGRKAAMVLVTGMMAVSLALIAFAPTYQAVGILAPLLVLTARLMQGFSAGGEFGTATALLIEMAPPGKRGFYGSWQMTGQMIGLVLGASAGALMTALFSQAEIEAWAWRIPFIFGLVIIPVAVYIRRKLDETEVFKQTKQQQRNEGGKTAVWPTLRAAWREIFIGIGLVAAATVTVYITFTYLVTYSVKVLGLTLEQAFQAQLVGAVWVVLLTPLFGLLSDKIGRRKILTLSLGAFLLLIYPLYAWLSGAPSAEKLIAVQLIAGVCAAAFFAVFSTVMAGLFPPQVRGLGLALSYNTAVLLIGGFAQFIVTWLIQQTGSPLSPAYYVMFGLGLGFISALLLGKRADRESEQ
ncbi:MFS transporter [Neisseria sp. ZJ106]|uniref:MFS transporter n=1 Tax=Neisseria lisongii TaxID=2912188 RepID=A0AAW5AH66_9NEIS|nr:MFS transporter [Neisseria lisongii]MCF7521644.1 MFS transporter [Neisseria lisongii]MCF7529422.1 MFS transporter [Neisseria lisongii]WCL70879.1 MFS transporter [Neisseria lisongii]